VVARTRASGPGARRSRRDGEQFVRRDRARLPGADRPSDRAPARSGVGADRDRDTVLAVPVAARAAARGDAASGRDLAASTGGAEGPERGAREPERGAARIGGAAPGATGRARAD